MHTKVIKNSIATEGKSLWTFFIHIHTPFIVEGDEKPCTDIRMLKIVYFFPYVDMPTLFKSLFYVITLITKVFLSLRPAPCRHVHFISVNARK